MGNACHPTSCCGGGDAFKSEQNSKERTLATEGSIQDGRRGRYITTEEIRGVNDTKDESVFQTAEGGRGSTVIYEEEERKDIYKLKIPAPKQSAYENEGSFRRLEREKCRISEEKKGRFSPKSVVPEWKEEEEEEEEKKREDYKRDGVRDFKEFNSVQKERKYRIKSEELKRRDYEDKRQKSKLNNAVEGKKYKENQLYQTEDRTYRQGNKFYDMEEIIYREEKQNNLSISLYEDYFSLDMQKEGYWITEESLTIDTDDTGLFWDPPWINPYDKPEKNTQSEEEDEEDKESEEIKLSMNLFPNFQGNDNTIATTTITTTTASIPTSTATNAAGLDGAAAAGWSVPLGKCVSIDTGGVAIEAFGLRATVGMHPSITFLGHSLLHLLSGPD